MIWIIHISSWITYIRVIDKRVNHPSRGFPVRLLDYPGGAVADLHSLRNIQIILKSSDASVICNYLCNHYNYVIISSWYKPTMNLINLSVYLCAYWFIWLLSVHMTFIKEKSVWWLNYIDKIATTSQTLDPRVTTLV